MADSSMTDADDVRRCCKTCTHAHTRDAQQRPASSPSSSSPPTHPPRPWGIGSSEIPALFHPSKRMKSSPSILQPASSASSPPPSHESKLRRGRFFFIRPKGMKLCRSVLQPSSPPAPPKDLNFEEADNFSSIRQDEITPVGLVLEGSYLLVGS